MGMPFDEAEAAATLGFPGEHFSSIQPYRMDDVYWVKIGPEGHEKLARPVLVLDGHVVRDKGYAVGAAWIRRVLKLEHPTTAIIAQMLGLYDALPLNWNYGSIVGEDPQSGDRGGVTLHPFEVKLVSAAFVEARPRKPWSTNGPVGPLGPSGPGPTQGPSGPSGPTGGPSGGPSGGYAPKVPCRARLVEVDGKLTWISETYDSDAKRWTETLRERIED